MRKFKKGLFLALMLALATNAFVACGGGGKDSSDSSMQSASSDGSVSSSNVESSSDGSSDDVVSSDAPTSSDDPTNSDDPTSSEDGASSDDPGHTHTWASEYTTDDEYHWYECTDETCDKVSGKAQHGGGTLTCEDDAVCSECGTVYEKANGHSYTLNTEDPAADTYTCTCGDDADGYVFNKIVSGERQELRLSGESCALSLDGVSAYTSVKEIYVVDKGDPVQDENGNWSTPITNVSLGTDITNLDVTALIEAKRTHGENVLTVVVSDDKGDHTISVPVLIVTGEISNYEAWQAAIQPSADGEKVAKYGYYVLTDNVETDGVVNVASAENTTSGDYGFRGTIDGNGYTVTYSTGKNGIFGTLGTGAVVKNITLTDDACAPRWENSGSAVSLARLISGTTFENVTVNLNNCVKTTIDGYGAITYQGVQNCAFNNVTFNVSGEVDSLLGGSSGAYWGLKNTTFANSVINIAKNTTIAEVANQDTTIYTVEGLEVAGATVLEGIVAQYTFVTLENTQELVLTDSALSLDLGAYADYTVSSIKLGDYAFGSNVSALSVSDDFKADTALHGAQEIVVKAEKEGKSLEIFVPVLIVTGEISNYEAWQAAVQPSADGELAAKYGYYVLTDNISTGIVNVANAKDTTSGDYGFRGTIDGNGYTVTYSTGKNGIFGTLGTGAVVKNITLTDDACAPRWENSGSAVSLARLISGTTFENVTINLNNCVKTTIDGYGAITYQGVQNCAFNNVTFNVSGEVDSLLGGSSGAYWGFKNTTFANSVINIAKNTTIAEVANQDTTIYTVEGLEVAGATVLEGIVAQYTFVALKDRQYLLAADSTVALDLGAYANYTVNSIKLGDNDLGTDVSSIVIPASIKDDVTQHGEYDIIVMATNNGVETEIVAPVAVVTKAISTMADFNATLTYKGDNIYGYYVLSNDISASEEGFTVTQGSVSWSSGNAFKATLNGRGYAVNTNSSKFTNGLLGTINGGTIKNITFNDAWNNNASMIAYNAYNATLEDVTININNGSENTGADGKRPIFGYAVAGNCSFTNVTITTKVKLACIAAAKYNYLTCNNVVVNGDVTQFWSDTTELPTGVTINK